MVLVLRPNFSVLVLVLSLKTCGLGLGLGLVSFGLGLGLGLELCGLVNNVARPAESQVINCSHPCCCVSKLLTRSIEIFFRDAVEISSAM